MIHTPRKILMERPDPDPVIKQGTSPAPTLPKPSGHQHGLGTPQPGQCPGMGLLLGSHLDVTTLFVEERELWI